MTEQRDQGAGVSAPRESLEQEASDFQMIRALAGIGTVCALLIALVYQYTLPIIQDNRQEALAKAIYLVLPGAVAQQGYAYRPGEGFVVSPQGHASVYVGYDDQGQPVGVAIQARGQGFQDAVALIFGYDHRREVVVGMQVLESRETPGLGDKIEKDAHFLANFQSLDVALNPTGDQLIHAVELVKHGKKTQAWQVDAITGATISSRAVTQIITSAGALWLPLLKQHSNWKAPLPAASKEGNP